MRRNLFLILTVMLLSGCGNPDLGKVSGLVTFDGQPLAGASVTFTPTDPTGVLGVAITDENGKYVMFSPMEKKHHARGVLAGNYTVTVSKKEIPLDPDQTLYNQGQITYDELMARQSRRTFGAAIKSLIPIRYDDGTTSGLTAEVQSQTDNVINFDLTSK